MTERQLSALYRHMTALQGERPWGTVLDAGTGDNSLRWIRGLKTDGWTAVTGSIYEADRLNMLLQGQSQSESRLMVGNWADPAFLKDETFNTVIADYLLGAVEGFSPYFQPYLFKRLRPLTGETLYVTGLEPYIPQSRPEAQAARTLWEIGRYRDACILLKGGLPYREYPSQWVVDQLGRAGFKVGHVKHFNIGYKTLFVKAQIDIALQGLDRLDDPSLVIALQKHGAALQADALEQIERDGALRACRNYVIQAKPV